MLSIELRSYIYAQSVFITFTVMYFYLPNKQAGVEHFYWGPLQTLLPEHPLSCEYMNQCDADGDCRL